MSIFYNFYILLATFYTIFGTNILIQCPVLVPVCCMFFVSQKIHIKQSPNGIKSDGDFFGICVNFGKWNQRETLLEGPTRVRGAPQGVRRALGPRGHSVRRLVPFFRCKKSNIQIKIVSKFQPNRSYGSPRIQKTVKGQNQGAQKQRETERLIQSQRGSLPSATMEAMDQRGNPSPI
ncbi:hypothetical protein VPH35_028902 [Triticum aestivum]